MISILLNLFKSNVPKKRRAKPLSISFQFSFSWYLLFSLFLLSWLILWVFRKSYRRKYEAKEQLLLSLSGLTVLFLMEVFAISNNLWNYVQGNWPVILWPTYFVAILFGYQLLRFIEGFLSQT
jgi:hypothetical protein